MANRLTRFLRLERPREARGDEPTLANEQRFEDDAEAEIRRLREERRMQFASGVETLEEHPDAQPFARCAVCEADNSRYALRCTICGANLNTPEQRAFNEKLWEARRAAEASVPARAAVPADPRYAMGVEIAREVGWREHDRMSRGTGVLGVRILAALPDRWRAWIVGAVLLEIAGTGIWAWHTADQTWGLACGISIAVVLAMFMPLRQRGRYDDL
jgi:hypothetical protein